MYLSCGEEGHRVVTLIIIQLEVSDIRKVCNVFRFNSFSWLIQDSANCSFVQSIFGHEFDGKSNVLKLSCKEIVAIFTIHVRD